MELKFQVGYKQISSLCIFLGGENNILPKEEPYAPNDRFFAKLLGIEAKDGSFVARVEIEETYTQRSYSSANWEWYSVPKKYLDQLLQSVGLFPKE